MGYLLPNNFLRLIFVVDTIGLEFAVEMNGKQPLRYKIDFMSR